MCILIRLIASYNNAQTRSYKANVNAYLSSFLNVHIHLKINHEMIRSTGYSQLYPCLPHYPFAPKSAIFNLDTEGLSTFDQFQFQTAGRSCLCLYVLKEKESGAVQGAVLYSIVGVSGGITYKQASKTLQGAHHLSCSHQWPSCHIDLRDLTTLVHHDNDHCMLH